MKIEILFPSFTNLYGEKVAVQYLSQCLPDAEFVYTEYNDEPAFVTDDVDMLYMGSMTESQQELVIEKLMPHKERITELIDEGKVFLMLGNALEIFVDYIEDEGRKIPALGLFNVYAKRQMNNRYHSLILGEMEDFKIVGFKAQFSHLYGDNSGEYLYSVIRGDGLNPGSRFEGLRRNNFMGTYTLGPMVILNPDFTKYVFGLLGADNAQLMYEDTVRKAYEQRLAEFTRAETSFL